ncbi:hypothetical protein CDL15_Pgr027714 [Punica granatum]|uniref:WIBG Mago-binding domain-containing protein n=1 Tax=Punica granatum TaxID=22663 RepID=A0A218XJ10_PUNGR|nr:hypothetical protein CDL15_Pgr027714 [Punica granatum]PKI46013.1 hypothetical protein CRG98_033653 [Punica granatum]
MGSTSRGEEPSKQMEGLHKTLKEGERILAPTRRPDGTLRKAIRIRAGYVPQEEVAIYQSRGALWKKEMAAQEGPPGYDPEPYVKPKTKSAKRNARKKEKRLQAALEKDKSSESVEDEDLKVEEEKAVESLASQVSEMAVSANPAESIPPSDSTEGANAGGPGQDIDKKIRALKKKIRLAEAQLQKTSPQEAKPEQMDKLSKLEGWREELKLLENEKSRM